MIARIQNKSVNFSYDVYFILLQTGRKANKKRTPPPKKVEHVLAQKLP